MLQIYQAIDIPLVFGSAPYARRTIAQCSLPLAAAMCWCTHQQKKGQVKNQNQELIVLNKENQEIRN